MAKVEHKKDWRDQYYDGKISVDEFLDRILNTKEGDRNRRNAERKYKSLFERKFIHKLKPRS